MVDNASRDGPRRGRARGRSGARVLEPAATSASPAAASVGARRRARRCCSSSTPTRCRRPGCVDALRAAAAQQPGVGRVAGARDAGRRRARQHGRQRRALARLRLGGRHGRAASPTSTARPHEVGFASGAALVVRRAAWDAVGGFDARYFMYGEDLDLSLRLRLAGWGIGVVPAARVAHDYSFDKGDYKWFYLERNRWWTLLGAYPAPLLALRAAGAAGLRGRAAASPRWRGGWLRREAARAGRGAARAAGDPAPPAARSRRRATIGAARFAARSPRRWTRPTSAAPRASRASPPRRPRGGGRCAALLR